MSNRIHHVAAGLALTALTAAQAFAASTSQIVYGSAYPQFQITTCFTRYFFTSTSTAIYARACDAGEEAGTIRVIRMS